MTLEEQTLALALSPSRVKYCPGSNQKRFALDMALRASQLEPLPITVKQRGYLVALALRYQRQVPEAVVDLATRMQKEGQGDA
ncbi:MAG: hypothetical protein EOP38_24275 [Rubrivivax sp.]|nr:MAG: hypothetical protein EOP38_24275 [Rubrivivax sp.]